MSDPNQEFQPPPPPPLARSSDAAAPDGPAPSRFSFSRVLWLVLLMAGIAVLMFGIATLARALMEGTGSIGIGAGLLAIGLVLFGWSFFRVDEMRVVYEPGQVFESLRDRPKFLIAGLILVLLTIAVTVALFKRVDMEQFIRQRMEQSSRSQQQTEEQKELGVKIGKIVAMVVIPASVPFVVAGGAALYLLGVMAFGGTISYKKALAVWVFSSLPPALIGTFVVTLVLFLKPREEINPEQVLVTNPGVLVSPETSPVLTSLLSQFDLLTFYGLFLAAIGLRRVAKLAPGSAWSIVLGYWLIGAIMAVAWKAIAG